MTFQEYLTELPLDDLKLVASAFDLDSGLISRARLLREIPERMEQLDFMASRYNALDPETQDLLLAIFFSGDKGYSLDPRAVGEMGLSNPIYHLLTNGFIIGRRGTMRVPEYIVPVDLRDKLIQNTMHFMSGRLSITLPSDEADESDSLTFIRDIFSFLNGLRREPARLTDRGVLYKRAMDLVVARLESKDDFTSSSAQVYPDRLDLLIGYTRSRRLLYEEEERFRCSSAFEQWLHLPTDEKADDLLAFWYARNHGLSSRTASLIGVLQVCVDMPALDLEALVDLTLVCTPGVPRHEAGLAHNRQWVTDALRELEWIGLVRFYRSDQGEPVAVVITPMGRSTLGNRAWDEEGVWTDRFLVQPTFEIIAPRTLELVVRNELERFADLASVDVTLTYRITKDTVYRAGDEGMSGEALIAFLERHSEKSVPQNVEYSVREWGQSYGQVYFMDVFLLRVVSEETATHIKAHRDLAPFIRGAVAPDALIVERHQYRDLMEALRKAGFMPRSQVVGLEPERETGHFPFARERFEDVWTRPGPHRLTAVIIGFNECLPGYRLEQRMNALDIDTAHLEPTGAMQFLSPRHTEELLELAITYQHLVLVDYFVGNRSRSQLYKIRPIRLERTRGAPYVEAQRILEKDSRAFKVANIKAIRVVYTDEEQQEERPVT